MKKTIVTLTLVFFSIVGITLTADAAGFGDSRPVKKGILLVAFGTRVAKAQASYKNIEKMTRANFPGLPIRWAYTSAFIRQRLAKSGQSVDSVEIALAKMMDEKFTHVAVQSLHTIAGWEFHELRKNAMLFGEMAGGFDRILVGHPLLAAESDFERVVAALLKNIPTARKKNEAVIFMGHGTSHPSNAAYPALLYYFQKKDPNVFIGTVEGAPQIDEIKDLLLARNVKSAYLLPFMSVAGDHAIKDMAGAQDDSWKSILTKAGIRCSPILKGTAEYDEIVKIWVDHLHQVVSQFD